jgi:hypothetical protein
MDNVTNSQSDLTESSDKFITGVYKEIAEKAFKSRLKKANASDDITKGIDYYSCAGTIQFKELKTGADRGSFYLETWPFETDAKNQYGVWQRGWVWHTQSSFLVFIRTIRTTGEWKCSIYDWKKLQPYILANIEHSWPNRFGSAKNKNFSKKDLEKYLIAELNN